MGLFTLLGRLIAKAPAFFAVLMPAISITFVVIGFQDFKVETSVSKLWIPESTSYAADSKYMEATGGGDSSSNVLLISTPRQGGNVLTAELLLELQQRLNDTQNTKVNVDGMTFAFADICYNPVLPYNLPCFRMHVLDCFAEGGYDFSGDATKIWQNAAKQEATKRLIGKDGRVTESGSDEILARLYEPLVKTGLAKVSPCNSSCKVDGHSKFIAKVLQEPAGTWESDPVCTACLKQAFDQSSQSASGRMMLDVLYVKVMEQGLEEMGLSITGKQLQEQFKTATEKDAINMFLMNSPLAAQAPGIIEEEIEAMLAGQTPYTFNNSRPYLKDPSTGRLASDAEVLATASAPCYTWDNGEVMPANVNVLLYGNPAPASFAGSNPLTHVQALEHIYRFLVPQDLQSRATMRPANHGGPLNISEAQAEKVLEKYKRLFEEAFSLGWNNDASGSLQHTAFTDDVGVMGTFGRALSELTTDSVPLIAVYGGLTVLLAALFFFSRDLVASQVVLVASGSILAILGCFAALALSVICGISLSVVHFWTMPFIIIGVGIDDMFMLALSSQTVKAGNTPEAFSNAFANVAVPVTMTSLVNAAMFAIMSFTSDIRAVYQAGYTGLMATVILHFTMLISFSALVYMDSQRRAASRYDCLPCVKAAHNEEVDKPSLGKYIYANLFKPAMTSRLGRATLLLLSLALLTAAAVGVCDLHVGLDLHDFFPTDDPAGQFAHSRNKYFPVWPVELNWGKIQYTDPNVQMQMARQWEQVLNSAYIAGDGLKTTLVWTAAFAKWGMTNTDGPCKAILMDNTFGLKLKEQGGFCEAIGNGSKCPVFEGLSEAQLADCVTQWKNNDHEEHQHAYAVIAPKIAWDTDGKTILRSSASGSTLFAHNLRRTDDYTSMIKDTRKHLDDDKSLHSWMSGVPFDYWEQYLTTVEVMITIGGLSIVAGFVISFVFIFTELCIDRRSTLLPRLGASGLGALLIALVSAASLLTVVGFCGLANIQLSGFTAMSCVMSTGLAVEYSVHVTHRFLAGPPGTAASRLHHAMEWLFSPTAMAFLTSAVSVLMMAFSEFRFVRLYFFAPLAVAVLTSYFFGSFALPCLLGCAECVPVLTSPSTEESRKAGMPQAIDVTHCNDMEEPKTPLGASTV